MILLTLRNPDASNLYDEEVTDTKEMYFSDDEAERAAKRGNRKKHQSDGGDQGRGRVGTRERAIPSQFNHQPRQQQNFNQHHQPQPPFHPHHPPHQPLSTQAPYPPMHYHQQQYHQNNPGYATYPNVPPPPGPPPRAPYHQQHYGYAPIHNQGMYANQMSAGYIPPPPPPNTAHPQQYQQPQYSGQVPGQNQGNNNPNPNNGDTVYYNYSAS